MKKVYICSPYRASDSAQLDRNIEYAQELTKRAIEAGLAPITPHLYMTQCLNEDKPEERAAGMAAGMALLRICDFVIVGEKNGISEGMSKEIREAARLGIKTVKEDKLQYFLKCEEKEVEAAAWDYAKISACKFCKGNKLHSCTGFDCREPYQKAYEYAIKQRFPEQEEYEEYYEEYG